MSLNRSLLLPPTFSHISFLASSRDHIFGDSTYPVIGVIGKSLSPCCNKMDPFDLLDTPASLRPTSDPRKSYNGRVIFYIDTVENLIYLHFETAFDDHLLQQLQSSLSATGQDYFQMNALVQSQFAKVFLFAASVCHLMVLTDPGSSFNSSYLPLFRALSTIRESKFLKYASQSVLGAELFNHMGKELRLCAPKMIFLFERADEEMDDSRIEQLEIDMEHDIYSALKAENLLSKNTCLFVLPKKLPFVHINRTNQKLALDPVKESMNHLMSALNNYAQGLKSEDIIEPHVGYGRPFRCYSKEFIDTEIISAKQTNQQKKHSLRRVIRKHVKELLNAGAGGSAQSTGGGGGSVDAEGNSSKSRSHRPNLLSGALWLACFESMHEMLLGQELLDNPDPEYVSR